MHWVNKVMTKSDLTKLVEKVYSRFGPEATVRVLIELKSLVSYNATWPVFHLLSMILVVPEEKMLIIDKAEKEVAS